MPYSSKSNRSTNSYVKYQENENCTLPHYILEVCTNIIWFLFSSHLNHIGDHQIEHRSGAERRATNRSSAAEQRRSSSERSEQRGAKIGPLRLLAGPAGSLRLGVDRASAHFWDALGPPPD